LSAEKVDDVIGKATFVTMLSPLGKEQLPEYGLDKPLAVVTLNTSDQTITLQVGAHNPSDNSYVVHASTSPYYVRVNDYNVTPLVESGQSDFLQPKGTPTP